MTSNSLAIALKIFVEQTHYLFHDSISPIVLYDSLDSKPVFLELQDMKMEKQII